jgi:ATP-dependent Lon protease
MTGEITLRGLILPVGGIKEKVLAAKRSGIKKVLLPKKNEKDVAEIESEVMGDLEVQYLERMETLPDIVLEKDTVQDPDDFFRVSDEHKQKMIGSTNKKDSAEETVAME